MRENNGKIQSKIKVDINIDSPKINKSMLNSKKGNHIIENSYHVLNHLGYATPIPLQIRDDCFATQIQFNSIQLG